VLFTTGRLIQEARGEYFCFCAADDRVLPGFFSQSLTLLGQHPQAGACTALVRLMGENGDDQGLFQPLVISGDNSFIEPKRAAEILRRHGTWYMGPAAIYRRGAFLDSGGLIAELGPMCDDFLFMVCALKFGVCHIPKPLAVWRKMEGTYSKTTSANRQKMRGIINHAVELMETTYRDIFPRDLIRRLRGRWLFSMETQQSSPVVRLIFFALLRPLDIIPFLARRLNLRNARV
jgi:glycosyltransferase involved in cell wall biosynthesis